MELQGGVGVEDVSDGEKVQTNSLSDWEQFRSENRQETICHRFTNTQSTDTLMLFN